MSPNNTPLDRQLDAHVPHNERARLSSMRSPQTSLPPGVRPRSEDSWIEVASQPSSSSLSSVAPPDEIITEGLRVQHDSNARRRRRLRTTGSLHLGGAGRGTGTSSQEEYEESESESDRIMTSSSEGVRASLLRNELRRYENRHSTTSSEDASAVEADDDEDDDENSTAVNRPRASTLSFRPQPNAFTHPPTQRSRHARMSSHSSSRPSIRNSTQRYSYPAQQHSPYNVISPSYQADHDAVLRASLSTLLSLGAAARGLPKSSQATGTMSSAVPSSRVETGSIRMVPESVAMGGGVTSSDRPLNRPSQPGYASSRESMLGNDKHKRKTAASGRSSSKDRHVVKKAKRNASEEISPTMFTWVISAGVLVLFSAISFSAGYMVGKETGRAELLGSVGNTATDAGRCGREAASGFKRLKWSGMTNAVTNVQV